MARPAYLAARDAALLRLSKARPEEFEALYNEERAVRGLPPLRPRRTREERIADLEQELADLRAAQGLAEPRPIVDVDLPPLPTPPEECCASGRCEVCRPDLHRDLLGGR